MFQPLLHPLKRFLLLPYTLITSPVKVLQSFSSQTKRGRALILGLPALFVAVAGVAALCYASFGLAESLENRYKMEAEKSNREKQEVLQEMITELRLIEVARQSEGGDRTEKASIQEDDVRRIKFEELQNRQRIFLEKLISLQPEELEYRYQLALISFEQGDPQRCLALMQMIAPETEPGHDKAHLWLSKFFLGRQTESRSELNRLRGLALQHAELCLKRDQNNRTAQLIKANLLRAENKLEAAYEVFDELFLKYPIYYENLVQINNVLDRKGRNKAILDRALSHFQQELREENLGGNEWVQAWTNIMKCLVVKQDFDKAEKLLVAEIEKQTDAEDGIAKRVFVEQLLANIYLAWARTLPVEMENRKAAELEFLKKAFRFNSKDPTVLRGLTNLAVGDDPELAQAAREIYDPEKQSDAPATVFNELGTSALGKKEYESAIRNYELARKKAPESPQILNNLAYAYLVCENRNPERALKLVDEAIRLVSNNAQAKAVMSHFFDTRGNALMQLSRMTEAQAAFEIALQDRPDNREILKALVKCSLGNNLSAKIYEDRLKKLDDQK